MKLFISYNHEDEKYIKTFIKTLSPLVNNSKIISNIWYDRDIKAGEEFWDRIDSHLANRDIICLFLSTDYLASKPCIKEMKQALVRRKQEQVLVIPIVLRPCAWLDVEDLSKLLAAPTDGKAVSSFADEDDAWMEVYNHLKNAIELHRKLKSLAFSDLHESFLEDATVFSKAHSNKNTLFLSDIFVFPDVNKIEQDNELIRLSSKKVIENFEVGCRLVFIGEDQSGKTSLLKAYIKELRFKSFIPIYVKDPAELLQGNFDYRLEKLFLEQYKTELELSEIDKSRIVPIVDDFHKANNKVKVIQQLKIYHSCIIVVDDIYTLDVKNDKLTGFTRYKIEELKPTQRNELVKNGLRLPIPPTKKGTLQIWICK